jgi:excisionase family DNA binding protein
MRRRHADLAASASGLQAPRPLGARPLAAVLEELAAVLQSLPPAALADAVGPVLGVVVREVYRPLEHVLAGAQALQDARADGLVTTAEAARVLRVHPWTVRAAIERGELPHVRIGRCLRIKTADLDAFVAARREGGWRRGAGGSRTT